MSEPGDTICPVDHTDRRLIVAQLLQLTPAQLHDRACELNAAPPPPPGWECTADGIAFHAQLAADLAPLRVEFDDDHWLSLGELLSDGVNVHQAAHHVRTGWRRDPRP